MITSITSQCKVFWASRSWAVKFQFHPIPVSRLPKCSTAIVERGVFNEGIALKREMLGLHIINNNIVRGTDAVYINLGVVSLSLIWAESPQSVNVVPEIGFPNKKYG